MVSYVGCLGNVLTEFFLRYLRDISIRMQTKDLRSINRWKRLDSFKELLQTAAFGDLVSSVETEVIGEHMLSKPYLVQVEVSLLTCKMHYVLVSTF